jgi:hypothetical protein
MADPSLDAPAPAPTSSAHALPPWAAWTVGLVFIAVAWFVALATPGDAQMKAAFEVPATIGQPATGRDLVATFTDLRRASHVSEGGWSADGNWLVVDLQAQAVLTEFANSLVYVKLQFDDKQFDASERPKSSMYRAGLEVGVPWAGGLAFELPEGVDSGTGRIEIATNLDPSLDSMVVLTFDLSQVRHVEQTEMSEKGRVDR